MRKFDNIFTPEKLSRRSSPKNIWLLQSSNADAVSQNSSLETMMSSLEEMVLNSQAACVALSYSLGTSSSSEKNVRQSHLNLESMRDLLTTLGLEISWLFSLVKVYTK